VHGIIARQTYAAGGKVIFIRNILMRIHRGGYRAAAGGGALKPPTFQNY